MSLRTDYPEIICRLGSGGCPTPQMAADKCAAEVLLSVPPRGYRTPLNVIQIRCPSTQVPFAVMAAEYKAPHRVEAQTVMGLVMLCACMRRLI